MFKPTLFKTKEKLTEAALIAHLKGSEKEQNKAIRQLWKDTYISQTIKKLMHQQNIQTRAWEDIFQDSIIKFLPKVIAGKFNGNSKVSTYFLAFAKLRCYEVKRLESKSVEVKIEDFLDVETALSPEDLLIKLESEGQYLEEKRKLMTLIGKNCRQLLQLKYFEKKSAKEMAKQMNWAVSTTRNNLSNCLQRLRASILKDVRLKQIFKSSYELFR